MTEPKSEHFEDILGPRPTRLQEVENFFYLASQNGWAGGMEGTVISERDDANGTPEWKEVNLQFSFPHLGYLYVDRWGTDPDSGRLSGHTIITYKSMPVWVMWTGGNTYNEDVYDFLQEVLLTTYQKQQFFGGRGPKEFRKGNLVYTNVFEGDFARFHGHESIHYVKDDESLVFAGSHDYWGSSLVFLPKRS